MEQSQTNAAWRGLITKLLDLPENYVRPANQNAPAEGLEDQFITVLIGSVTGHGGTQTETDIPDTKDVLVTTWSQRKATATIQAFGPGSFDLLLNLNVLMEGSWGTHIFQQANIGMIERRGPNDLTTLVPALLWQRRAILACDFYFVVTSTVVVPAFGSFSWRAVIDDGGYDGGELNFDWEVGTPFPKCPIGSGRKNYHGRSN